MNKWLLIFFVSHSLSLFAQEFKVVGYLPYYRFDLIEQINFSKITHLNLAFLNPDIDGNLSIGETDIDPVILLAKTQNPDLKVFISLAGGAVNEEWSQAYNKFLLPEYRSFFAQLLLEFVIQHNLDGIDVDLEWSHVNEYYSPFVQILADSLKSRGKQITAALPATYRYPELNQEALDVFDFINLMAYDKTGPWRPNEPGPHSPKSFAEQSITYWRNQGLDNDRMILGVPFYGYDFTDQANVMGFTFGSMVDENPHYAYSDKVDEKYYNGIPTIQYKVFYALNEVSGIMIWELGQDAFGENSEFSLLSAIDYVVQTRTLPVTGNDDNLLVEKGEFDIQIYPNPFHDFLTISSSAGAQIENVSLCDLQGRKIIGQEYCRTGNAITLNYSGIQNGLFMLKFEINGEFYLIKILKIV